jgi:AAHS family 4-hydroxybenzoate transporter-like MFS transporter
MVAVTMVGLLKGESMSQHTIDVSRLIDERRITSFNVFIMVLSFLVISFAGYGITIMSFAVPHLLREWHIAGPRALGPVFSAGLFGILFGAPIFGYVGDRFGRKVALVSSCLVLGILTLITAWATSLGQLFYLRALAGVATGGLMPNLIALNGEYAPRRHRATMIILFFLGMTVGGSVPGFVSAWLVPSFGWRVLFYIGGIGAVIVGCLVAGFLPESVKFLVVHERYRSRAVKVLKRLVPDLEIGPQSELVVAGEKGYSGFKLKLLFSEGMAFITVLLWVCFIVNLMGYYFLISWIPTLLTTQKVLSLHNAALAASLIQIAGTLAGLILCRPMETKGFVPVATLFTISIPCVALIGFSASISQTALILMLCLVGFCLLGLQFGLNAASAMIYPTAYRSNASGWAFGIGRFGSIVGPILGGFLIQMQLSLKALFLIVSIPFVIGTIACWTLAKLYRQQFKGVGLGEREMRTSAHSA